MHDTPPATPRWIGWAVVALAVLMVLQGAFEQYREHERDEERGELLVCLTDWASELGDVLEQRSRLNAAGKPTYTVPIPDVTEHCEGAG